MSSRKHALWVLGDGFKDCTNIELAKALIAGNYVNNPKFELFTKKRATRILNNLYKRSRRKGGTKKSSISKNTTYQQQSVTFLNSWAWRTLRYEALLEHGRRCMCCGATPDDGTTVIHVDHIKPRNKYPELALEINNLQVLCSACNQGKGAWDETDFRDNEEEFQIHLADTAKLCQ